MKYTKYTPEENLKLGRLWGRGHTGRLCTMFPQAVIPKTRV